MPEQEEQNILSVTQLNEYIRSLLDSAPKLSSICIKGEISNFTNHKSGHLYFSLKDESSLVRAVMFRSAACKLKFLPENGMKVIAKGSVTLYVRDGSYQLYVTSLEPDGIGALYLAYEQLKRRLEAEGLFAPEQKRPLPKTPTRVGVITSPTGAAVRDIIHVTGRRFPLAEILLYPALVQGDGAPESLIRGLQYFNRAHAVDVIIIGRGGGSIEDLWAFNNEELARAVAASTIPVISAVGHETDFTICDFVADRRAPTPSAAAEIAVPEMEELKHKFHNVTERMSLLLTRNHERLRKTLDLLTSQRVMTDPEWMIREYRQNLDTQAERLRSVMNILLQRDHLLLGEKAAKMEALSPLSILHRGYGVVSDAEGKVFHSVTELHTGEEMRIRLADGYVKSTVTEIQKG